MADKIVGKFKPTMSEHIPGSRTLDLHGEVVGEDKITASGTTTRAVAPPHGRAEAQVTSGQVRHTGPGHDDLLLSLTGRCEPNPAEPLSESKAPTALRKREPRTGGKQIAARIGPRRGPRPASEPLAIRRRHPIA